MMKKLIAGLIRQIMKVKIKPAKAGFFILINSSFQ